jgi:hypothetical protein
MNTRRYWPNVPLLAITLTTVVAHAAPPVAAPGLWQITIVDFAERTSQAKECLKSPDWNWWLVYLNNTAGDESCKPPATRVEGDVVGISQKCKSVSAEMTIVSAGDDSISGKLTTFSVTPYGMAIPFQSTFEARRLSDHCP